MLKRFLEEEVRDRYEVLWRYEFHTNSIVVEMRDGLVTKKKVLSIDQFCTSRPAMDFQMIMILRGMMHEIENYRKSEQERLKGENDD